MALVPSTLAVPLTYGVNVKLADASVGSVAFLVAVCVWTTRITVRVIVHVVVALLAGAVLAPSWTRSATRTLLTSTAGI